MVLSRVRELATRAREELLLSVTEQTTPKQVAGSFAIGTFITMLPTLGAGFIVFAILLYFSKWINKVALLASVIVFNPVVKWGVYIASITLGFVLLGPVEGFAAGDVPSLDEGWDIVLRLVVGNLILAVVAAVIAYIAVYRLMTAYERERLPVLKEAVTGATEAIERHPPTEPEHHEDAQKRTDDET